ncbi:MAG: PTS system mannose/fructose/sorbose family transporter subunit IID [Gemmatimonadetes bacterium]|nr:PTS system mannose/fructose/sorbose family transporter subunit IID [Gemmatimonadota bacterium]MBK7783495.1 PTS system mannose/fructose/sorbose family transporter subunit IID [Gemmatimonadota bacterium]
MTSGFARAYLRLLSVQGAWNFERMTGIGMGYAAEPLLEDLKAADPARHAEAAVRSAEYFNSHPYLAGLALGALVRAEYDQVPGPQIDRLRTALTGPLGSLGDQFFWAGLVPAVIGGAVVGLAAGYGWWAIAGAVLLYNAVRLATGVWALRTGLDHGMKIGAALGASWLPHALPRVGHAAGLLVGIALPLGLAVLLEGQPPRSIVIATGTMLVALLAGWRAGPHVTSVRFGLAAIGGALALAWSWP